jgi:hypothetical protein
MCRLMHVGYEGVVSLTLCGSQMTEKRMKNNEIRDFSLQE